MPVGPGSGQVYPNQQSVGPNTILENMIVNKISQSYPQFRDFFESMKGKDPQQAFNEKGLDYNQFMNNGFIGQIRQYLGI